MSVKRDRMIHARRRSTTAGKKATMAASRRNVSAMVGAPWAPRMLSIEGSLRIGRGNFETSELLLELLDVALPMLVDG